MSSGPLAIGAIRSAVLKKNGLYLFFDSHFHGQNGLSSVDGASIITSLSSLDDLVTYLYAFYDSMKIDMNLQFDFLAINVRQSSKAQFVILWMLISKIRNYGRLGKHKVRWVA